VLIERTARPNEYIRSPSRGPEGQRRGRWGSDPPPAYVAEGSHATYPRAGRCEEVKRVHGNKRVGADDIAIACPSCPQWRSWERLCDAARLPWYGFGGAWGRATSSADTTGPLGPSPRNTPAWTFRSTT
jgi:hypothetical protein